MSMATATTDESGHAGAASALSHLHLHLELRLLVHRPEETHANEKHRFRDLIEGAQKETTRTFNVLEAPSGRHVSEGGMTYLENDVLCVGPVGLLAGECDCPRETSALVNLWTFPFLWRRTWLSFLLHATRLLRCLLPFRVFALCKHLGGDFQENCMLLCRGSNKDGL
eukprot:TsM_000585200 transcript=TsM_000585200 gene=TsM_000585200